MELLKTLTETGHTQTEFTVEGRNSLIVSPKNPLPGNPWVWRTEFFGAFDYADQALLDLGWHLAYHCVSNMYGCPESVTQLKEFHTVVLKEFNFNPKAALFGFSRGGLYAVNYAKAYPDDVLCLYLDAPVVDMLSWPGGKGEGIGDEHCFAECLACYHVTEEKAQADSLTTLDGLEVLKESDIPVIVVAGDTDDIVPFTENGKRFYERYKDLGGNIKLILKPGIGHHPHSLENPEPITAFISNIGV